jgi:hypothetical protein
MATGEPPPGPYAAAMHQWVNERATTADEARGLRTAMEMGLLVGITLAVLDQMNAARLLEEAIDYSRELAQFGGDPTTVPTADVQAMLTRTARTILDAGARNAGQLG